MYFHTYVLKKRKTADLYPATLALEISLKKVIKHTDMK